LVTRQRYHFKKEDKLKSRKAIEALFSTGKSFSQYPFKFIWLPQNNIAHLQAGVGVSSKQFKKAVDRNRIKRLMREAWRLKKNPLQEQLLANEKHLSVFILYIGKEVPEYNLVLEKIELALKRLLVIINEQS
jgi:ribonuclease P protein component